jgi:hypothetical protein
MKTTKALSLVLALTLAPVAAVAASLQTCAPQSVSRPAAPAPDALPSAWLQAAPANPIGCVHGISFRTNDDTVLWRCQVIPAEGEDLPEGHPEYAFLVIRAGEPMQVLPDELMAGRYHSFELFRVDLDGDGTAEHVLAAWNAQSNGMGVHRWTIRVFDPGWKLLATFSEVADWGNSSLVRAPRGRGGCDLAITGFVESLNRAGRQGISLQARFQRLMADRMVEAEDRPAIQRRYDRTFESQRTRHFDRAGDDQKGDVARWLSHPDTQPSPRRPAP